MHRWPAARVAEAASVSRPTVYKCVRRFLEEGIEGLNDRSSAPHRRPRALPAEAIEEILAARQRLKQGPHRLGYALGRPRSSIYGVLRRHGLARLDLLDRPSGRPILHWDGVSWSRSTIPVPQLGGQLRDVVSLWPRTSMRSASRERAASPRPFPSLQRDVVDHGVDTQPGVQPDALRRRRDRSEHGVGRGVPGSRRVCSPTGP